MTSYFVYSCDTKTREMGYKRVVKLYSNNSSQMVYLTIGEKVIKVTPEHPFYIDGVGWISAGDLKTGDEVKLSSSASRIIIMCLFIAYITFVTTMIRSGYFE